MTDNPAPEPMLTVNSFATPLLIVGAILLAGFIWLAGDIFTLFLISLFLAYAFDPLAARLTRSGMPRWLAAMLIVTVLVVIVVGTVWLVGPLLYEQAKEIFQSLRGVATSFATRVDAFLSPHFPSLKDNGLSAMFQRPEQPVGTLAGPIAARVFSGGVAFAGFLGLALLSPMIMFYLLKDWPAMTAHAFSFVPARRRADMRALAAEMHKVLSAFLHGQAWVCAIDAVLYSAGLMIVGVQYAIVIGIVAGALKFLPYVGAAIGLVLTMGVSLGQSGWDGWQMAGIGLTFLVVEIIENVTYPRIVGEQVKLPPVFVIFAVLFGGKLMGVLGVFVAVPAFAVARVAVNFWLRDRANRDSGEEAASLPLTSGPDGPHFRSRRDSAPRSV